MSPPQALAAPPLSAERTDALRRLTDGLDGAGLWWLSGYAAGLATHAAPSAAEPAAGGQAVPGNRITVVHGSQTGNARRVAERLAADLEGAGLAVRLVSAGAYPTRELKQERYLYLVVSTQGDGDPPDDARDLCAFLTGKRAPALPQLRYAVLGLGDSSYPRFCAVGQLLDARLAELGATRLLERGDADLDIDGVATPWRRQALSVARESLKPSATVTPLRPLATAAAPHDRGRPFAAEVLVDQRITASGSDRDIRHFELSLEGSGLHYEPGDALGVLPRNSPALVEDVLAALRLDGDTTVALGDEALPLREWLELRRELTRLARPLLVAHAARAGDGALAALLAPDRADALAHWIDRRQLIDLLREVPADWDAAALVAALRPLTPRLYSIASSRKAVGDEAHLTVAHLAWARGDAPRFGVASHFLASAGDGAEVPVYVEPNERFRLPADPGRDLIMIGAGTGVAPFRGFLQERVAVGASGRHWLFFGNPRFRSDFLYQLEWQRALKQGQLQRIDLAFSRDPAAAGTGTAGAAPAPRTYVQRRIRERGRELYAWLEGGAHLYVCGALAMGRDVHAALAEVIATHGGRDAESAAGYLDALRSEGRYSRDVY
ncbi:assimilatory sulfite reductase (NADPH) flavoprotein subunit [Luteimonas sp. RD2P54]|uniref:Sulfite reductase [NADPH] flavoprotein alpha-component n=1 Tax=Luteimonas endophytica TaxID=3042023 RepID=A0ABT6JB23_9GAMM|nr:assimilatory sulfite reductase (NADPH) flavoprotein subunit [Luteimonas endophytica]MDH5824020.1 assimilatory sulfite reductase (NADPH) flavoprotein subunit [Luteimonas endophytica]